MKQYYAFLKYLRKQLPIKNLNIRRRKIPADIDGDCSQIGNKYLIRISNKLSCQMAMECLLHEYSHVIAGIENQHNATWGKSYARVYRVFLNWIELDD